MPGHGFLYLIHQLPAVRNIRKKLGSRPGSNPYILNELGVGYRMIDEDPESRQTAEEGV